jgi:excisionase family DNA binding protein
MSEYYSPREAAEKLPYSERHIRRLLQRGDLEGQRDEQGHWRIPKNALPAKNDLRLEKSPDVGTTLGYISEFFVSYRALRTMYDRANLINVVLSLVLLALAAGAATTKGAMTFSGVGLEVSLAVLLSGGAIVLGMVVSGLLIISRAGVQIEEEIIRLYESIGFSDHTLLRSAPSPFTHVSVLSLILGGMFASREPRRTGTGDVVREGWRRPPTTIDDFLTFGAITELLVTLSVSAAAETAAGFKVAALLRPHELGWIWIVFIVLAVVSSGVYIANLLSLNNILEGRSDPQWRRIVAWQRRIELFQVAVFVSIFPLMGVIVGILVANVLGSA